MKIGINIDNVISNFNEELLKEYINLFQIINEKK